MSEETQLSQSTEYKPGMRLTVRETTPGAGIPTVPAQTPEALPRKEEPVTTSPDRQQVIQRLFPPAEPVQLYNSERYGSRSRFPEVSQSEISRSQEVGLWTRLVLLGKEWRTCAVMSLLAGAGGCALLGLGLGEAVDIPDVPADIIPGDFPEDTDFIFGGEDQVETPTMTLPEVPTTVHQVGVGETLSTIAARYGTTPELIWQYNLNQVTDPNYIEAGWVLVIPLPESHQ